VGNRPALNGKQIIRILKKFGFEVVRIEGSHHMLMKLGHPTLVVVPVHGNRTVPEGTLRNIIRQAGLTADVFFAAA
jgi:predicted RNA binding protein YcfA (HicA-like mRNA interferase family)